MSFKAKVPDVFQFSNHPDCLLLMLNHVEGEPKPNDLVQVGNRSGSVIAVNDGGIRSRSCLTGQKIPNWAGILVKPVSCDKDSLYQSEIAGESDPHVL